MKDWKYNNEQWTHLPQHLRHLPLISKSDSAFGRSLQLTWASFLKEIFFRAYIRLKVKGSFQKIAKKHKRLLIISNHSSHLDAISIASAVPYNLQSRVYAAAAKDYFFSNPWISFFSKYCINAIPIDRKNKSGEAIKLCIRMLQKVEKVWMIVFPEGTRTPDGKIHPFKRGVSVFAERSNTPILFLYMENAYELWPKGAGFAKRGKLTVHLGPIIPPSPIEEIYAQYKAWVKKIDPKKKFADED